MPPGVNEEQANRLLHLLMRHYNGNALALEAGDELVAEWRIVTLPPDREYGAPKTGVCDADSSVISHA